VLVSCIISTSLHQSPSSVSSLLLTFGSKRFTTQTLIVAVYLDLAVNGMQHHHSTFQKLTRLQSRYPCAFDTKLHSGVTH